tara:strand:- start:2085 stop:2966 length:882 start_codon:yes stop_codon:yes gene_type:complete
MIKVILIFISLFFVNACSSSYEKLKNTNGRMSDNFKDNLFKLYKEKAVFEAEEMHDWNSAKLYSEKALKALNGYDLKPQDIKYWKLPKNKVSEIQISYDNLMSVYNRAQKIDPNNLAVAISSLDCWAEQQEENWQSWDIIRCKDDFLNSMHTIYNTIAKIDKNNLPSKNNDNESDNLSLALKSNNKEIIQIVYFDFDKSKLSRVSINKINKFLAKRTINNYIIVGHTDTKGTKHYNLKLSLNRAQAVKNVLIRAGIDENNVSIIGKGEGFLAVKTDDEVKHPANRRVEIFAPN